MSHKIDHDAQMEQETTKTNKLVEKYGSKKLKIAALFTALFFLGVFAGFTFGSISKEKKQKEAEEAIFLAQLKFGEGKYSLALNGNDEVTGFLYIADEYSSTSTGNVANHYAGVCLMKLKDYNEAIVRLKKYNDVSNKEVGMVNAQNKGLIADAYVQLKDYKNAITYYEAAVKASDNNFTTPYYLIKLGELYMAENNNAKALECFELVKNKYYTSFDAREIDKYIGKILK